MNNLENQNSKQPESKKKIVLIAFAVLFIFYAISKSVSLIATNPAKISYDKRCSKCHGEDGKGIKDMLPPLADSDWLRDNQNILACVIKNGIHEAIIVNGKEYDIEMLGEDKIQDIEITNIINYINTSWGNKIHTKKNQEIIEDLKNCK